MGLNLVTILDASLIRNQQCPKEMITWGRQKNIAF
jgi:hypothetical protein